jgi:UDP-glucuronate decarboxylase
MDSPDHVTGPINIGNPGEFTIRQLAEAVLQMVGGKSQLVMMPLPQDDPKQRQPDITLARQMLGWEPKIKLEVGLGRTIEYFRKFLAL